MKNNLMKNSILAGISIGVGTSIYLACSNTYIGAILFCIGLFVICYYRFSLFTGVVGYAIEMRKVHSIIDYIKVWVGNLIGCLLVSIPLRVAKPELSLKAQELVSHKFSQNLFQMIIFGVICGMLVFFAVDIFRTSKSSLFKIAGIVFCITGFIVGGFEHSIADMCFMIYNAKLTLDSIFVSFSYIVIISVSNALGSILICNLIRKK